MVSNFLRDSTEARLNFARQIKRSGINPKSLDVHAEFDEDDEHVFIFADDADDNTQAVIGFPLALKAWNESLRRELVKLFRGSAILAKRGR